MRHIQYESKSQMCGEPIENDGYRATLNLESTPGIAGYLKGRNGTQLEYIFKKERKSNVGGQQEKLVREESRTRKSCEGAITEVERGGLRQTQREFE